MGWALSKSGAGFVNEPASPRFARQSGVRSFAGRQFVLQPLHLLCQLDPTFGDQLEIDSLDCIILGLPGSLSCLDCPSSILLCPCIHDSRQCEAGNSPAKSVVGLLTDVASLM